MDRTQARSNAGTHSAPTAAEWLGGRPGQWRLYIAVQPGASRTEVVGPHDGCLKLRVASPPTDGKANDALLAWLAGRIGVARRQLTLESGAASRRKRIILFCELDAATLLSRLYQGLEP